MKLLDWLFPGRAMRRRREELARSDEFARWSKKAGFKTVPLIRPLGYPCWDCDHDCGWHGIGGCESCDCSQEYCQANSPELWSKFKGLPGIRP